MADVDFLGVARPDQQFPPATASVWTVPSNAGPDVSELPPRYFDISIVPNNAVLHYNQVVPYDEPSKAVVTRKVDGVRTLDPLLDANPDQVWLYFMTYLNERPSLNMNIHCFHIEVFDVFSFPSVEISFLFEHYTTQERTSTGKGRSTTRTVHHTRSVTDMNFSLDLTEYVCRQWWRVTVIPSNEATKKGKLVSLRDAIEQYTRLDKSVKEIICNKQLQGWDFEALSGKVRNLVQANGHYQRVSVVSSDHGETSIDDDLLYLRHSPCRMVVLLLVPPRNSVVSPIHRSFVSSASFPVSV